MNHEYRIGEGARVAVLADVSSAHLLIASGSIKLCVRLAAPAARAIATELQAAMPADEPATRRPGVPRIRAQAPTNWPAVVARIRSGRPLPQDADAVAGLLSYLGLRIET